MDGQDSQDKTLKPFRHTAHPEYPCSKRFICSDRPIIVYFALTLYMNTSQQ